MTDPLSDVLRAVRLTGAVFFAVDCTTPWVAETPAAREVGPYIMPGIEHVIEYHVLTSGRCWAGIVDEPAVQMAEGDIIVFPHGDPHVMSSAPGMRGQPDFESMRAVQAAGRLPISVSIHGGGSERAHIICGFLGCDARPFNPLLATLPRMIHLRSGSVSDVLRRLVELAVTESDTPKAGSECVLSHLSELLFVEVVRRHVASLPPEETGWFAGLRDPHIGRALQRLHEAPAHPWTLEDLAKQVGLSRSTLAERFNHLVGVPPIQYLAQWRIQLAASLLRSTKDSLAEIAGRVGYGSEVALSHAFKRQVGVAPTFYRRAETTTR
jgi:AraC-like DNA-binding protein